MASITGDSSTSSDDDELSGIQIPRANDVLCGRGGHGTSHPGNLRFRMLVEKYKAKYATVPRCEKSHVALEVVWVWRKQSPPGRFLTLTEPSKGDASLWHDIGDRLATQKASQGLREKAPKPEFGFAGMPSSTASVGSGAAGATRSLPFTSASMAITGTGAVPPQGFAAPPVTVAMASTVALQQGPLSLSVLQKKPQAKSGKGHRAHGKTKDHQPAKAEAAKKGKHPKQKVHQQQHQCHQVPSDQDVQQRVLAAQQEVQQAQLQVAQQAFQLQRAMHFQHQALQQQQQHQMPVPSQMQSMMQQQQHPSMPHQHQQQAPQPRCQQGQPQYQRRQQQEPVQQQELSNSNLLRHQLDLFNASHQQGSSGALAPGATAYASSSAASSSGSGSSPVPVSSSGGQGQSSSDNPSASSGSNNGHGESSSSSGPNGSSLDTDDSEYQEVTRNSLPSAAKLTKHAFSSSSSDEDRNGGSSNGGGSCNGGNGSSNGGDGSSNGGDGGDGSSNGGDGGSYDGHRGGGSSDDSLRKEGTKLFDDTSSSDTESQKSGSMDDGGESGDSVSGSAGSSGGEADRSSCSSDDAQQQRHTKHHKRVSKSKKAIRESTKVK